MLYVISPIVEYGINRRLNLPGNEVTKHIYYMDYDLIYKNIPDLALPSRAKQKLGISFQKGGRKDEV